MPRSQITLALVVVAVVLGAAPVRAHDVPVAPSTCTLDTVELGSPALGLSAAVAPPRPDDVLRIAYSVATATAQLQQRQVAPRAFSVAGVAGTLAVPQAFDARLTTTGDLTADHVALAVTLGGVAITVPVTLTTGLLAVDGGIVAGEPMTGDGQFALVAVLPAGVLPPPLAAGASVVRLGCPARPVPDLRRFGPAAAVESLAGVAGSSGIALRAVLRGDGVTAAALTAGPAMVRITAGGVPLAAVEFPAGLAGERRLVARSAAGDELRLRLGRASARLRISMAGGPLPALAGGAEIEVTLVAGTTIARGGRPFRARGDALRAGG